jgi:DNA-directed RNA polymerase alpha subunit
MALDPEEFVTLTDHGTMKLRSAVSRAMMLLPKERKQATIVRDSEPRMAGLSNPALYWAQLIRCEEEINVFLYPTPELPDDTPIDHVRFTTRIRNVLNAAGIKTVGDIRKASDKTLLSLQDLGQGSVTHLRETLGLPSTDGLGLRARRPPDCNPPFGALSRACNH